MNASSMLAPTRAPMRRHLLAATVIASLAAPAAHAEGTPLAGDAIRSAFAGSTFTGTTGRGGTWRSTYSADGRLNLVIVNSDWRDSGTWEVKDDRLCSERGKRAYRCLTVMKVSESEYHLVDDRGETTKAFRE